MHGRQERLPFLTRGPPGCLGSIHDLPSVPGQAARRLPGRLVVRLPAPPGACADAPRDRAAGRVSAVTRLWPDPVGPLTETALAGQYPRADRAWLRVNFVTSLDGAVSLDGY